MIIVIDAGTTSTRALLISSQGEILAKEQQELKIYCPQPGWAEQDPEEIWSKTAGVCRNLVKKSLENKIIDKNSIEGIAITNQRETTILWDSESGNAIYNAISWQCQRTSEICHELKQDLEFKQLAENKTGLLINPYFSLSKILWILQNTSKDANNLKFSTVDSWLINKLTGAHATDTSNASRSLLFDIYEQNWEQKLIEHTKLDTKMMPKVTHSNSDKLPATSFFDDLLGRELQILGVLGDQQAAFYAYKNQAKITYGTGTFAVFPCHDVQAASPEGLIKSVAYTQSNNDKTLIEYLFEASIFIGGSLIQWFRDELKFIEQAPDITALAQTVNDNGGVYLIPAFAGLGAPFWRDDVRGSIFGITRATSRGHLARAALEALAFQVRDAFEALDEANKKQIDAIYVDGGASRNDLLMQIQADALQIPILRCKEAEMTALGAARITGKVDFDIGVDREFVPQRNLDSNYSEWKNYISTILASSSRGNNPTASS